MKYDPVLLFLDIYDIREDLCTIFMGKTGCRLRRIMFYILKKLSSANYQSNKKQHIKEAFMKNELVVV